MVVKTLNNILPKSINKAIIEYLVNECAWCVARDANRSCHDTLMNLKSYLGFTIDTMDVKHHEYLNVYANIVIEKVKEDMNGSHTYFEYTTAVSPTLNRGDVITAIIRTKYSADDEFALLNNLNKGGATYEQEYETYQLFRARAKEIADSI